MSADSPKRSSRCVPTTVPPQAVSDRSLLDSVTGFINDVTLTNVPQIDPKDQIQWARFENTADVTDPTFGEDWDLEGGVAPPLLLILGYGNGVQVWAIPANGEAVEVLSWRHGNVRALRVLPLPILSPSEEDDSEQGSADTEVVDQFAQKRPLMAVCDASATGSGPQYCSINFISLKDGDQVKTIKFKNPILDILANRSVVVVTFSERIAVFDAKNFEDRLTVTTCHPSTNFSPNPVALGSRWLAYAERKLLPSKRSSGGCDGDGVTSYTATVLNAAKSLGKGLRELGEQMAAGLAGVNTSAAASGGSGGSGTGVDDTQPGVVTILDIKYSIKDTSPTTGAPISSTGGDPIIAHFIAHSEAIVAMAFDCSGMLLSTADRRGHDFHIFRIQPHPGGPSLSAVHHLYVLHRGDTTAKVQDIQFSLDSRWIAVSTLRGTTHVFPVTPYGGPAGARTHGSPHVVNRLSRFHRSAGLSVDGRSSSPVNSDSSHSQITIAYNNPRVPPFPHPLVVLPLAQLRQPSYLGQQNIGSQGQKGGGGGGGGSSVGNQSRQRLTSLSDESSKPLRICATFAKARAWLLDPPGASRDLSSMRMQRKAVDSLFIMASHGALIQYDLEPRTNINIPKDKICDDTSIELDVEPKAQWNLLRKETSQEIQPPLPTESWLLRDRLYESYAIEQNESQDNESDRADRWLSQVEILTHAGPHRRLWMGPQFTFKTYNTPSGAPLSHIDSEAVEVGISSSGGNRPARSNPMNMPLPGSSSGRSAVPVLIESGSYEQSPRLIDQYRHEHMGSDFSIGTGDSQLREDLADAMRESPGGHSRDTGLPPRPQPLPQSTNSSATARTVLVSIAKVVNPLGTVTTLTQSSTSDNDLDQFGGYSDADDFIHENCDEALFRPVVAVYSSTICGKSDDDENRDQPIDIGQELIVPVIDQRVIDSKAKSKLNKSIVNKEECIIEEASNGGKKGKSKKVEIPPVAVEIAQSNKKERKKSDTNKPKVSIDKDNKMKKDEIDDIVVVPKHPSTPPVDKKLLTVFEKGVRSKSETELVLATEPAEVVAQQQKISKKLQKKQQKLEEQPQPQKRTEIVSEDPAPQQAAEVVESSATIVLTKKSKNKSIKVDDLQLKDLSLKEDDKKQTFPFDIVKKSKKNASKSMEKEPSPAPSSTSSITSAKLEEPLQSFADMMKTEIDDIPFIDTTFPSLSAAFERGSGKKNKKFSKTEVAVEEKPVELNMSDESLDETGPKDIVEEVVAKVEAKKPVPVERTSKQQKKNADKSLKVVEQPVVNFNVLLKKNQSEEKPDATDIDVMTEDFRAMTDDCSNIQASLFRDPVVTTTFTIKKSKRKSSFDDSFATTTADTNATKCNKNSEELQTFTGIDFDYSPTELDSFTFAPLQPFDINFEQLTFKDASSEEPISLINFESPEKEDATEVTEDEPLDMIESTSTTSDKKLIFTLCESLPCDDEDNYCYEDDDASSSLYFDKDDSPPPTSQPLQEGQDSDYKSLEFEIDETYLSLELPVPLESIKYSDSNSSDDTEDSSQGRQEAKTCDAKGKYKHEMDEELEPLIGLTQSTHETLDITKEMMDEEEEEKPPPPPPLLPTNEEKRCGEEDTFCNQIDINDDEKQPQQEPIQQQQQQPQNVSSGSNKKKIKKKRR